MRKYFVAGNWKMNKHLADARELVAGIAEKLPVADGVDVGICPPFFLLFPVAKAASGTYIRLGAQNCYFESAGAFTGETSPTMLKSAGCVDVIIGHSERRQIFGESGDLLKRKVAAAIEAGLDVIYCIGETLEQREAGATMSVVDGQLSEAIEHSLPHERVTIAYEPVWAIGTGKTATPDQAQEVHQHVRGRIGEIWDSSAADAVRIQYGGSVKPGNAAELMACPDVDGALVGGACLVADDFVAIIAAAQEAYQNRTG
jgi:triosephosphate isomerase